MVKANPIPSWKDTVNQRTGTTSLWKLGKKTNRMALSWKWLEDLTTEGIGIREIESQAWRRTRIREEKKGATLKGIKKGPHVQGMKRDARFVKESMKIRVH